jgi:hypothetical protein
MNALPKTCYTLVMAMLLVTTARTGWAHGPCPTNCTVNLPGAGTTNYYCAGSSPTSITWSGTWWVDTGTDCLQLSTNVTASVSTNCGLYTVSASVGNCSTQTWVYVIRMDMARPEDKANSRVFHYAFDNSTPGLCRVSCIVEVCPDDLGMQSYLKNKIRWSIDSVSGSALSWQNGGSGPGMGVYSSAFHDWREEAIYTGLPVNNSAFGEKNASVTIFGLGCSAQGKAKVFFDRTAKNHPGPGSGTTPNWYYYWSQTSANYGSHSYDESIVAPKFGETVWQGGQWVAKIGRDDYMFTGRWGGVDGVDHFANTTRHESQHVTDLSSWWPTGYNSNLDADGDYVPDSLEPGLGYDPTLLHTDGDGDRDVEDHAYDNQPAWTTGSADSADWSKSGHQWGPGYSSP